MPKFRKKPDNNIYEVTRYRMSMESDELDAAGGCQCIKGSQFDHVHTAHNQVVVLRDGDWIMPEPDGRGFYPIKPDIFADRYELANGIDREAEITELKEIVTAPIDMIIFCPSCGKQHVDEPEPDICKCGGHRSGHVRLSETEWGGCASDACESCSRAPQEHKYGCLKFTIAWSNPPHKSHRCVSCNVVFRIADVPTNGVKNIQTKGENDTWAIHVQSAGD
jgi:hypothetical protein